MSRSRYGHADAFNVEEVPAEARAKALVFAIEHYRRLRDAKKTPKVAYQKTWYATQRAAYGVDSKFGYFIRYGHQIGEIVGEAQRVVEGARAGTKHPRP
jgi:hypothetical protein